MTQIRRVKPEDNAILATLIREVFHEYNAPRQGTVYSDPTTDHLYDLFRAEKSCLWVAESDQEIVGCCGIYPTKGLPPDCVELVKFYIKAGSRGQGVGKLLMENSIRSAIEFGYTQVYLESLPVFAEAVRLYEKQGFTVLASPLGESGHTSCTLWMLKEL